MGRVQGGGGAEETRNDGDVAAAAVSRRPFDSPESGPEYAQEFMIYMVTRSTEFEKGEAVF